MGSMVAASPFGARATWGRRGKNTKMNLHKSTVDTNPHKGWRGLFKWRPKRGRLGLEPVLLRGDYIVVGG